MTITDVFTQFDIIDKKGFDTHEIVGTLSSVEENEKGKPEFCFENLALSQFHHMMIIGELIMGLKPFLKILITIL